MRAEAVPIQQEPAFDRLLDVLAEHLVETYVQELEAEPTIEGDQEACGQ